jgi:hypothetical protein
VTLYDAWETQAEDWTRWAREPNFATCASSATV